MENIENFINYVVSNYYFIDFGDIYDRMIEIYNNNDISEIMKKISDIQETKVSCLLFGIIYDILHQYDEMESWYKKSSKLELEDYNLYYDMHYATLRLIQYYAGDLILENKDIIKEIFLTYKLYDKINMLDELLIDVEAMTIISKIIENKKNKKNRNIKNKLILELSEENEKLKKTIQEQEEYIRHLEYMPNGEKYKECKDHFEYLCKQ
jgi:hypothetical protein